MQVACHKSDIVQRLLRLNGRPFSIREYPYFEAIYNTGCREIGLFTARQIAKSTFLASDMVINAVTDPIGTNQVLVTPLQDQAYVFSTQRLRDFIHESPIIKNGFFTGPNVIDNILMKKFNNNNLISIGYAQRTADRLRGRSAGKLCFDEMADIAPAVIPVVKEMAFRVGDSRYKYCGTPKSLGNHMETYRARSTANEWAVKCQEAGCGAWNFTWTEKNVGPNGVICEKCAKPINTNLGQWVCTRRMDVENGKDARITMESYRIPQLIVKPVMDLPAKWRELLDKVRDYPSAQLYNEVFGLPYDSGSQPISIEQLTACCDSSRHNRLPDPGSSPHPNLVMGIDWAFKGEESYTFVIVGYWKSFPHEFVVLFYKIFKGDESDSLYQINWVINTVRTHNIRLIGSDWGAGHVQNLQLVNALGESAVAQVWHTSMKGTGGRGQGRAKWDPKTRKWHLARTAVLTDTFEDMRHGRTRFPRAEECDILFSHILAETLEYSPDTNRAFYTNATPDDALHALCYAQLAGELLIKGNFGGHLSSAAAETHQANNWSDEGELVDHSFYA